MAAALESDSYPRAFPGKAIGLVVLPASVHAFLLATPRPLCFCSGPRPGAWATGGVPLKRWRRLSEVGASSPGGLVVRA
jgi:hypothetical protein